LLLSPYPYEFSGEGARLGLCLLGLRRVALGAFGGLEDEAAGFGLQSFEVGEVAIEFAGV